MHTTTMKPLNIDPPKGCVCVGYASLHPVSGQVLQLIADRGIALKLVRGGAVVVPVYMRMLDSTDARGGGWWPRGRA